jgi:hypothetical protein
VKNQNLHLLIALFAGAMIFVAGYLTFSGLYNDFEENSSIAVYDALGEKDRENCVSLLDTSKYFEEPCYEFVNYQKSICSKGKISDGLSKTIVKVTNSGNTHQPIEGGNIKYLPLNTSLNIMLETYTVSRLSDTCDQYLVTVESFSTKLEKVGRDMTYLKPSASLSKDDMHKLKKYLDMYKSSANNLVKLEEGKFVYQ